MLVSPWGTWQELYSERQNSFFLFTQQHFTAHIRQAQDLCLAMEKLPSQELCPAFALLSLVTCLAVDWCRIWRHLVPRAHVFSCLLHVCRCFSHLPGSLRCPPHDFKCSFWKRSLWSEHSTEQGGVELCHHRNRIMKLENIPRYLDLKWSHQKSPDLFNLQIVYHTKIKKPTLKWGKKRFV